MNAEISRHGVPADEFKQLKNAYPLGKYYENESGTTKWFVLIVDMTFDSKVMQTVQLTWFKEWRV